MDAIYVTQTTIPVTILHKIQYRKVGWIVKWYGKYRRKVSWIVKRYGNYGRKVSWNIVKWYGK